MDVIFYDCHGNVSERITKLAIDEPLRSIRREPNGPLYLYEGKMNDRHVYREPWPQPD